MQLSQSQLSRNSTREFAGVRHEKSYISNTSSQQASFRASKIQAVQQNPIAPTTPRHKISRLPDTDTRTPKQRSLSGTKLLCVGCFNQTLSSARQKKKALQYQTQQKKQKQMYDSMRLATQGRESGRYDLEYRRMNQYNKMKCDEEREKKREAARQKQQQELQRLQDEVAARNRADQQTKFINAKKEQVRKDLQMQIQRRREVLRKEAEDRRREAMQPIFEEPSRERARALQEQLYRSQLLHQINSSKQKKQFQKAQQQLQQKQARQLDAYNSQQRKQQQAEQAQHQRQQYLYEAQQHRKTKQLQKQREAEEKRGEQQYRIMEMQISQEINQRREGVRQRQVDQHMKGLKFQIQATRAKRKFDQEEEKKIGIGNIFRDREVFEGVNCGSCEKAFPYRELTQVPDPFEL